MFVNTTEVLARHGSKPGHWRGLKPQTPAWRVLLSRRVTGGHSHPGQRFTDRFAALCVHSTRGQLEIHAQLGVGEQRGAAADWWDEWFQRKRIYK